MAVVRTLAAGRLASVLVAGALPTPNLAVSPTCMDPFDPAGKPTGSAVVAGERIESIHRGGCGERRDEPVRYCLGTARISTGVHCFSPCPLRPPW